MIKSSLINTFFNYIYFIHLKVCLNSLTDITLSLLEIVNALFHTNIKGLAVHFEVT